MPKKIKSMKAELKKFWLNENTLSGRTDGFKLVNFPGDESRIGKFVKVRITEGKTFSLDGEIVK